MSASITTILEHSFFGGAQGFHEHDSREIGLPMIQSFIADHLAHHAQRLSP